MRFVAATGLLMGLVQGMGAYPAVARSASDYCQVADSNCPSGQIDAHPDGACTLHVDPERGSDQTGSGRWLLGTPFRTIACALASAEAGDTIELADGTYGETGIVVGKSLTIRSANGWRHCIMDCASAQGLVLERATVTLQGMTFLNGLAVKGGAIQAKGGTLTVHDCVFADNRGIGGGGAIDANAVSLTVKDCLFHGNRGDRGGAIGCRGSGTLNVTGCEFYANISDNGGAINAEAIEDVNVASCMFVYNQGGNAGGALTATQHASLTLVNCVFAENEALDGGGCYVNPGEAASGGQQVLHCTFSANEATSGGGMYYTSKHNFVLNVTNCIFWGNRRRNGESHVEGSQIAGTQWIKALHCDIQGMYGSDGSSHDCPGADAGGNMDADPDFAFSDDPLLVWDSPCIDAGTTSSCLKDRHGRPRSIDGDLDKEALSLPDMGAYEHDPRRPGLAVSPRVFSVSAVRGYPFEAQLLQFLTCGAAEPNGLSLENDPDYLEGRDAWLSVYRGDRNCLTAYTLVADPNKVRSGANLAVLGLSDPNVMPAEQRVVFQAHVGRRLRVHKDGGTSTEAAYDEVYRTLESAIAAARDGDVIAVADEEYDAPAAGLTLAGKAITVKSESGNPRKCIIHATQATQAAFDLQGGERANSIIDGFTIVAEGSTCGINCAYSSPTIKNCVFRGSSGVQLISSSARIRECTFSECTVCGISVSGMKFESATPEILKCTFGDNASDKKRAGRGISLKNCLNARIVQCRFYGGPSTGVKPAVSDSNSIGTTISDCSFTENKENDVSLDASKAAVIRNCTFTLNTSGVPTTGAGGAIAVSHGSSVSLRACAFHGKQASASGGAVHIDGTSLSRLSNCVFAENTAKESGGGLFVAAGGAAEAVNCTFYDNRSLVGHEDGAPTGQDVYSAGSLTLLNCILWGGSAGRLYSASGGDAYCWIMEQKDGNAPRFCDAAAGDFRLMPDSPCIDCGKNTESVFSDIRGSLRPVGGDDEAKKIVSNDMDIGAYEYSSYFSGEHDGTIKAFQNVRIPQFAREGTACTFRWEHGPGFPDDTRINRPGQYRVVLSLVSEDGLDELYLTSVPVPSQMPAAGCQSAQFTFRQAHVGRWRLRVALADDPSQWQLSDGTCYIAAREPKCLKVGEEISRPRLADQTDEPTVQEGFEKYFFWSEHAKKLYAIGPVNGAMITWTDQSGDPLYQLVTADFNNAQIHLTEAPRVELLPAGSKYSYVEVVYTENDANLAGGSQFTTANRRGYSVVLYGTDSHYEFTPKFKVIQTKPWRDCLAANDSPAVIGAEIVNSNSREMDDRSAGWIYNEISPYDADLYGRQTRTGHIFPVNLDANDTEEDDLVVFWYERDEDYRVAWPVTPVRYALTWPTNATLPRLEKIVVASERGSEVFGQAPLDGACRNVQIYNQPDRSKPGFNPNEEHAALYPSFLEPTKRQAAFALQDSLNQAGRILKASTSEPYVLMKYEQYEPNDAGIGEWVWEYRVFKVVREETPYLFKYAWKAGLRLVPPYPLSTRIALSDRSYPEATVDPNLYRLYADPNIVGPFFQDYHKDIWARRDGEGRVKWFYPRQEGFWCDQDGDGENDPSVASPIAFMASASDRQIPVSVTYDIDWPETPILYVGETLLEAKRGLPDILNQQSVQILYDQTAEDVNPADALVRLYDPLSERRIPLASLFNEGFSSKNTRADSRGNMVFTDLPYHLRTRCFYDPIDARLVFAGYYNDRGIGEPILIPNLMSQGDRQSLLSLSTGVLYARAVEDLYEMTWDEFHDRQAVRRIGAGPKALSAGSADSEGYVTVVFSADEPNCAPLPISVKVLKVQFPLYAGEIKIIEPDNVFDERLTLRHSGDFGGEPEDWVFEWQYCSELDEPKKPSVRDADPWKRWDGDDTGGKAIALNQVTIRGNAVWALKDMWFSCRYRRADDPSGDAGRWSEWTEPQLHESWVKRVIRAINPLDQRIADFRSTEVNTLVSMIGQAGERYEGDVALTADPTNLNEKGLIEIYQTLLDRARSFSVDSGGRYREDPVVSNTLLMASSRLADLYTLLGNEAYADALDPTIGFAADQTDYEVMAPSLFCFQNEVGSLLEEELALLRGLDRTEQSPLYNRLIWNFASGDGQVAYVLNYNISDQDATGDVNEYDARKMYPQGHGDAWGHYLTAIKMYYDLLRDPNFTWVPRTEAVVIAQVPVSVDYLDERKFAQIAAAKARTGAEIVDLTYRQNYSAGLSQQAAGYPDADPNRAWGVSQWAQRAGQGAYFDWVVANAILPSEDSQEGIKKIDRTTVLELKEIAAAFTDVQARMDQADKGLSPLGIAGDTIPFDINPYELVDVQGQPTGRTHFEQVYDRAMQALSNTVAAFNLANRNTQLLRRQQDTLEGFKNSVEDREADFNSRLIEIFGYPYEDDIGPTGTYPDGYRGPDLYHFEYVEASELMDVSPVTTETFEMTLNEYDVDDSGGLTSTEKTVEFHLSKTGLGLIKPEAWTGMRRAPGEIQFARSDLLQARARFEKILVDYDNLLQQIEEQAALLQAQYDLNAEEIQILNTVHDTQISLNEQIAGSRKLQLSFRTIGRCAVITADAWQEFFPKVIGLSTDTTCVARAALKLTAALINESMSQAADAESLSELSYQQAKEIVQSESNIELTALRSSQAFAQQLAQLKQLIRSEASVRLELFTTQEAMQQASGRYLAALARGQRLQEDRLRFRKQTAKSVQDYRYKDMAFRIFRNEAVQKYRAQFDMAAQYACLAAKAYDYETTFLDPNTEQGSRFFSELCRQRTIGQIEQGVPIAGQGLAGMLAQLKQNFDLLKGPLGFNNPQVETNYFSLRSEKYRIGNSDPDADWQKTLRACRVDDLWTDPKYGTLFKRYCKPFAEEGVAEPAIVIPFGTVIESGKNFFGCDLEADAYYAPENFATKVRSVGVWFSNYDTTLLSPTPRVYLIPVGEDRLRTPAGPVGSFRNWRVFEQCIPEPFSIAKEDLDEPEWIPMADSVSETFASPRRYVRFRAYPDGGFDPSEMTYDSRLVGRSVWNTEWLLIIPGSSLRHDPVEGIDRFIDGLTVNGGVTDIRLFFKTYAYPGY